MGVAFSPDLLITLFLKDEGKFSWDYFSNLVIILVTLGLWWRSG
jgi:hypothetical protein